MRTFTELVHDLPTEIFDEIKALTFTVDGDDDVEITKDYKPPIQLQIDRASRAAFAEKYYAVKSFILPSPNTPMSSQWLESHAIHISQPAKKLKFPMLPNDDYDGNTVVFKLVGNQLVGDMMRPMQVYEAELWLPLGQEAGYWTTELDIRARFQEIVEAGAWDLAIWNWVKAMIMWVIGVVKAIFK